MPAPAINDTVQQGLRFAYMIEPPFCFRTRDGKVTGCDVELARLLAERLGLRPFHRSRPPSLSCCLAWPRGAGT